MLLVNYSFCIDIAILTGVFHVELDNQMIDVDEHFQMCIRKGFVYHIDVKLSFSVYIPAIFDIFHVNKLLPGLKLYRPTNLLPLILTF